MDAFHDSEARDPPPRCHPKTRIQVISDLTKWIKRDNTRETPGEKRIVWVSGPLGAGKTAVFQHIAEALAEEDVIIAAFFFSRAKDANGLRGSLKNLFTTIAYQIAMSSPEIRRKIGLVVDSDNTILHRSLESQLRKLIIEPLQSATHSPPPKQCVVIIDDLDGCHGRISQYTLITQISNSLNRWPRVSLTFLIGSRPDHSVQHSLDLDVDTVLSRMALHFILTPSPEDVRTFLIAGFERICIEHPSRISSIRDWPSEETIDILVERSSGYFIYPSAVLKFVGDPKHLPVERLDIVLSSPEPNTFSELDKLYTQILSQATDGDATGGDISLLLRVLGCILLAKQDFSASMIESLLNLRKGDTHLTLQGLHAILDVPNNDSEPIRIIHASFMDFIFSPTRAGRRFHIDPRKLKKDMSIYYMEYLKGDFNVASDSQLRSSDGVFVATRRARHAAMTEYAIQYLIPSCREVHQEDRSLVFRHFKAIPKQSWMNILFNTPLST